MFKDKTLLITGGTGSFGNAMVKRCLNTDIRQIRIFSRDPNKQEDMRSKYKDVRVKYYIGDVRNRESLRDAMSGVDYVFLAAALKQVPSCEFYPMEAILTNSIGTENALQAALENKVSRAVVLSTDKAAYPINVMGMTKGLAERIMGAKSRVASEIGLVFCATRYGNVMASRGSVIPHFIKQIETGQPLTVTDPKMTRFMMTLEDAVELVLYAFEYAKPGDLFVQKAPAATIQVLAEALKELLKGENPIKVIGTRHGEKLYETLLTREEMARAEDLPGYFRVPSDERDLNYESFFSEGMAEMTTVQEYHSHNTLRLSVEEMVSLLLKLPDVREAIARCGPRAEGTVIGRRS